MYDDIAMHELNPRPGVIINHPQGDDVYTGVPKVNKYHFFLYIHKNRVEINSIYNSFYSTKTNGPVDQVWMVTC